MKRQNNKDSHTLLSTHHHSGNRISDRTAGGLCIFYLLLILAFLGWLLFDTWIGRYSLLVGYAHQREQTLRLIAFTLIAGALGGVVNGLRSTLQYRKVFDRRHTWKYLCAPWMGATLALFVYALLRSSTAALGGNAGVNVGNVQVLSYFAVGALVGYGSKDVFFWLDARVAKLFQVASDKPKKTRSRKRNGNKVKRASRSAALARKESVPAYNQAMEKVN